MALDTEALKKLPDNPDKSIAIAGKDTLLSINTGTTEVPKWTKVGGQRNSPINMTAETLDANHKTSGGWASTVPGMKSWNISYSGLLIMDEDGLAALEYCYRESKQANVRIDYPNKTCQTGWAFVTEFDKDVGHDAIATVSITLSGVGPISEVAASH